MVTSVNTNINAMAAIQSLDMISNQMSTTQSAIESGLKVNSAADNPAVFTIAQGLRGNVDALSAVSSNLTTATATIQAQMQGATSISNALNTLLQTVTQGQGESGAALAATNATITNALSNIDAYANASTINGTNLLATASTFSVVSNVNGSTTSVQTTAASTAQGLGLSGLQLTAAGTAVSSSSTLTIAGAATGPQAGDSVTYMAANGAVTTFTFAANAGNPGSNIIAAGGSANQAAQNLVTAINTAAGSTVASMVAGSGAVTLTGGGSLVGAISSGSGATYATSGGPALNDTFTFQSSVAGSSPQIFTFGTAAGDVAVGANTAGSYANLAAAMTAAGISATASNTGVLTVVGGTVTSSNQAAAAAGSTGVTETTANSGAATIDKVNAAIAQIGATLSKLGSTSIQLQGLTDFTTQLSDSVTTGLGAMVDANLSSESAMLSSLQTKQSLAIQSLTLANQGPSSLLQLFR